MRIQQQCLLAGWLIVASCALATSAGAQEPPDQQIEDMAEILSRMERRLDELQQENAAIRTENAQLLDSAALASSDLLKKTQTAAMCYKPGEGVTIAMLNNTS